MLRETIVIPFLLAAFSLAAQPDLERDRFSGVFAVSGSAGERAYRGELAIEKNGQAYKVMWKLDSGETYDGVGIATGDTLSVGWNIGETAGVAVYDFSKSPIVGKWSTIGDENVHSETLVKK